MTDDRYSSITTKYDNRSDPTYFVSQENELLAILFQRAYIKLRRIYYGMGIAPKIAQNADIVVSHRHRSLLVAMPKSGSRSLLVAFLGTDQSPKNLEVVRASLESLTSKHPSYQVVAIVRNPWDRAFSCYTDKIASLDRQFERARRMSRHPGLFPYMSFDQFVQWLASPEGSDKNADAHWLSQNEFLKVENKLRVDHFFQLENLSDRIGELREILNDQSFELPHTNTSPLRKSTSLNRHAIYNDSLRAIVGERYAEDIRLFGYEF